MRDLYERRERRRYRHRGRPPILFGLVVLALGILFLLGNLHLVRADDVFGTFWPVVIVLWGLIELTSRRSRSRFAGGLAVVLGSVLLANHLLGWDFNTWNIFWPGVLIAFGVHLLYRAFAPHPSFAGASGVEAAGAGAMSAGLGASEPPPADGGSPTEDAAVLQETAFMSHVARTNLSQTFRGGTLSAFMGGMDIDLTGCRLSDNAARLDLSIMMGGVDLRIPRNWRIESRLSLFLAGVDDRSAPPPDGTANRLVLTGSAFLGGVTIRN